MRSEEERIVAKNKRVWDSYDENTHRLQGLVSNSTEVIDNCWQPARPEPSPYRWASFHKWKQRLHGALLVLIGKAQFIRWYK